MTTDTAPRATRREWIGLAVLALPTLLLSLDVSVLYLALPQLSADLGADSTQQLWILDIYSFMLAGFLVTMGTLGDRIGRRRLLLIGAAAFGVASVAAAYSTSAEMLIATRALLGIAGATLMPSTMALIRNMFRDPKQMAAALGVWFFCFMGGMAVGPLVGGVAAAAFWWGSAFLLGVPFMAAAARRRPGAAARVPRRERRPARPRQRRPVAGRDPAGHLRPQGAGPRWLGHRARRSPSSPASAFGVRVRAAAAPAGRPAAGPAPVRQPRVRHRARRSCSLTGIVMAGISLMATLYLQVVRGLSPLAAGLWLLPTERRDGRRLDGRPRRWPRGPAGAHHDGRRAGRRRAGLLVHDAHVDGAGGLPLLVVGLVLAAGGISLADAAGDEPASSAPRRRRRPGRRRRCPRPAASSASRSASRRWAASAPSSTAHELAGDLPAGVPSGAADAARDSITAATAAAAQLPGPLGAQLLDAARTAFTSGLTTVAGVGAVPFVALVGRVPRGAAGAPGRRDRRGPRHRDPGAGARRLMGVVGLVLAGSALVAAGGSALSRSGPCEVLRSDRAPAGREEA